MYNFFLQPPAAPRDGSSRMSVQVRKTSRTRIYYICIYIYIQRLWRTSGGTRTPNKRNVHNMMYRGRGLARNHETQRAPYNNNVHNIGAAAAYIYI